ncbi:hypothetical protein SD71_16280 [Cohnella kolymensis]|uniref:Tail spike domain-containing protein n=1 Tax=Cohnella kolymensis TaxID=1590652 RepID=A0ABR5A2A1_9BACL|nr:phage tail protein [Cohnella kolymensis]KIL35179.1 hypothetical protein SD71_16280 [Cohnella kolymensis]
MKRLLLYDKNMNQLGAAADATDIERQRRVNSDYTLSFVVPMSSDDYNIAQIKGHVKDDRSQYYVINDRSRKREGVKRMVQFDCMHVMFKLADFKFPYASYIEEAFGVNIATLLNSISAATNGKFSFSVDDKFDLQDIKDFGRGNCLQALNYVVEKYGCEVEPDNFVIHLKKQIGMDRGFQARIRKNIINVNFKDSSRALVTRMFSQMKDGLTFIGLNASNLTQEEYDLLNAVPGAIVGGIIKVNYLISPYAGYWSNTTNSYYDGEIINQEIEDPLELLKSTRKALREQEVPAIEVPLNVADLHKIDREEPEIFLGDTIRMFDSEMQINDISARVMEIKEYPYDPGKQPDITLANYFLRDYDDIIADLDKAKQIVTDIISGGKVRTSAFENFAAQAVHDINNSKSEVIYDPRGIVLQSKVDPNDQVVLSSAGLYITLDGGQTAEAALTAAGLVAEKVVGVLGNFITIEIGSGSNVFKSDQQGIYLGNQSFGSAPFRVNMAGELVATEADITGMIHATGGSFSGDITAYGTITGGTLIGATIKTANGGTRVELSSSGNLVGAYLDNSNYNIIVPNYNGSPAYVLVVGGGQKGSLSASGNGVTLFSLGTAFISASSDIELNANGNVVVPNWSRVYGAGNIQSLQQALDNKVSASYVDSNFATNMAFDQSTRNLKLYSMSGSLLATVNIP